MGRANATVVGLSVGYRHGPPMVVAQGSGIARAGTMGLLMGSVPTHEGV